MSAPRRSGPAAYALFERLTAAALTAADPVAALERAAAHPDLPPELRRALAAAAAQTDGVRLGALLVAKLRFERLLRGCPEAEEWFERDPEGFSAAFRTYHGAVAPRAFFPPQEAELFREWVRTEHR